MRNKSVFNKWIYGPKLKKSAALPDPRIAIVRQLDWVRSSTYETNFTLPEPDNYNRAVFTERAVECPFIKYQVIYKSEFYQGWFTVCYVPAEQQDEFDRWAGEHSLAIWRHSKPSQFKQPRRLLARREYYKELSTNERLYTLGYYKNFAIKYFEGDTTIVKSLIGEARADLINFIPEDEATT